MRGSLIGLALASAALGGEEIPKRPNFVPDPHSVQRCGPGYRYPQCGWIVVHIEGGPYERGYQYGKLLAGEIGDFLGTLGKYYSEGDPALGYRQLRNSAQALFLPKFDLEWREEMKGIADGAADGGAKVEGRKVDLIDLVALNSEIEFDFLNAALKGMPTGLEGKKFAKPANGAPAAPAREHCSAFIATAPATADGKIVFGHITMWNLEQSRFFNVWLDVKPSRGQRCAFQTIPGGIMSGMDYYYNGAGVVLAETTIAQTPFAADGLALASRCRSAIQYGTTIDEVVKFLSDRNNGLYTNEWLIGDTKSNEIAMFEMGTAKQKLWRSSRNEWPGGTPGFYWGCNNAKDVAVNLESHADLAERPHNAAFRASGRDREWVGLYGLRKGKIDEAFGFEAFTAPRLSTRSSLDAKFATADQIAKMSTWAVFGPPRNGTWQYSKKRPNAEVLRPNDWTVIAPAPPPAASGAPAADLGPASQRKRDDEPGNRDTPAWNGTILPASDADTWLAAGWAKAEGYAALENSLAAERKDGGYSPAAAQRLARARFALAAERQAAGLRAGAAPPLAQYRQRFDENARHDYAATRGAEFLLHLRSLVGAKTFDAAANDFGVARAGQSVAAEDFRKALEAAAKRPLQPEFDLWLQGAGVPDPHPETNRWSLANYLAEADKALIVYGTAGDVVVQREAALELAEAFREDLGAAAPRALPDTAADDAACRGHHLLVIGRPATNRLAARLADRLPLKFGTASFQLAGKTYANEETGVVAVGANPLDGRYSLAIAAGLGVNATARSARALGGEGDRAGDVLLLEAGQPPRTSLLSTER